MARPNNLSLALSRVWDNIAAETHAAIGRDTLIAPEVREAVNRFLDNEGPRNRSTRKFWTPLTESEKKQALERAFPDGPYWMVGEDDDAE